MRRPKPLIHIRAEDLGMRPMQGDALAQRYNERWYRGRCGTEAPSHHTTNLLTLPPLAAAFGTLCPDCKAATCSCVPCTTPAYGAPGIDHCAACCYGSLIAEYNHDCPVEEHREMAIRQFGPQVTDRA